MWLNMRPEDCNMLVCFCAVRLRFYWNSRCMLNTSEKEQLLLYMGVHVFVIKQANPHITHCWPKVSLTSWMVIINILCDATETNDSRQLILAALTSCARCLAMWDCVTCGMLSAGSSLSYRVITGLNWCGGGLKCLEYPRYINMLSAINNNMLNMKCTRESYTIVEHHILNSSSVLYLL